MSLDFLRKDSFFFMRDEPVDLKHYLPQWLNRDALFSKIMDALSIEHEQYRVDFAELAKQFYVETTSDFERWEQLLKITPAAGASDELRRATIRVKRRGGTVMTVENTKRLLADFAPRGEVDIRELGGNKLELLIHNGTFWWEELMQALMEQLPAHLTFDFEISRTLNHPLHVGIIDLQQGRVFYDQLNRATFKQPLRVLSGDVASGFQRYDINGANVVNRASGTVRYGMTELVHGKIRFECENEIPDNFTAEDWERYLRKRWAEFKQNPVVEYYKHNGHGDWGEGEIDDPDNPDEPEFFPVDKDFLRLYWKFPYQTKQGEQRLHLRYTTHYDPREDLTSGDIKAVGEIGAASGIFVHSKKKILTTGLFKALLIHKHTEKII